MAAPLFYQHTNCLSTIHYHALLGMSRTLAYKPPLISRRMYQLAAVVFLILGFILFSDFIGIRGPSEERTPIPEGFGLLFILVGSVTYMISRRWINCPHCNKE